MYDFPLRKAMKETCDTFKDSNKNNNNNNNKFSVPTRLKKKNNANNNNSKERNGRATNEFGHGALHRAVINDEEKTIQR